MSPAPSLITLIALAGLGSGCGVSEQVLRDEQGRTRRFREAWETQGAELGVLRERLAAREAKGCEGTAPKSVPPRPGAAQEEPKAAKSERKTGSAKAAGEDPDRP